MRRIVGQVVLTLVLLAAIFFLVRPSGVGDSAPIVEFSIPTGASFTQVADTLEARGLVETPTLFRLFAMLRGDDHEIRAGRFAVPAGTRWVPLLDHLVDGPMLTDALTIPEGFTVAQIAQRLAAWTGKDAEAIEGELTREGIEEEWDVPGPGLEGYLFPDTYHFVEGVEVATIVRTMIERYQSLWTDEWRARADTLEMSEREIATLASIIQAEAVHDSEMPTISGVYHNRLRIGYLLQADPTVQYALEERRSRLFFSDIDSVADHPYNTYTQRGLPPGPIGQPGAAALRAALYPADVEHLYFVARPDGTHIFTNSLEEHNRARVEARAQWDALEAQENAQPAGGS